MLRNKLVFASSGLESIYNLTAMTRMSLRVDLRDKDGAAFAKYSTFELVKRNYKLIVGGYSGTAGEREKCSGTAEEKTNNGFIRLN